MLLLDLLVLAQGVFHLVGNQQQIVMYAPDWVISEKLLSQPGLPLHIHKIVGTILVLSALYTLYKADYKKEPDCFSKFVQNMVTPILILIALVTLFYLYF